MTQPSARQKHTGISRYATMVPASPPAGEAGPGAFAQRLVWARLRAGLSLRQLAKDVTACAVTLSRIERGQSEALLSTAWDIARRLGVRPAWLAYGDGEPGQNG